MANISRVGHAHPDFFQGGRLPTLLSPCTCRRPWDGNIIIWLNFTSGLRPDTYVGQKIGGPKPLIRAAYDNVRQSSDAL